MHIKFIKDASVLVHPGYVQPMPDGTEVTHGPVTVQFHTGELAHVLPGVSERAIAAGIAVKATDEDLGIHADQHSDDLKPAATGVVGKAMNLLHEAEKVLVR